MEVIKIAELEIDNKKLLKSVTETKKSVDELTQTQKDLKKAGDTNSETFIKNEAELKSLKTEYNKQIKVIQATTGVNEKLTKALNKEIKGLDQAKESNVELKTVRNQLNAETEEGAKAIDEINKKIDENNKFIEKNTSNLEKQKQGIGGYQSAIEKAKIGSKAFGVALKAMGIGLIIAGVAKLTEAFGRNQKVANALSTIFNTIGIVFDKLVGTLVDTFQAVSKATGGFDALGSVLGNLIKLGLTPIQLAFQGIKAGILGAQLIWEKSFFGGKDATKIQELESDLLDTKDRIVEIGESAIESGKQIGKNFGEAIDEVTSLTKGLVTEVSKIDYSTVIEDAKALTDIANNMEALIIAQEGLVQIAEREAEQLRQIRDDESNSLEDRKKANEDLGVILEKQATAELKLVGMRIGSAEKELSLNKGNIELQNEVLRLKNEQLEVENRIEGQRSEKLANDNSLRNEELAQIKEFENQKRELQDEIDIENAESDLEKEELRLEQEFEKQVAELERLQLNEEQKTELLALLTTQREQVLNAITDKFSKIALKNQLKVNKAELDADKSQADARANVASALTGILIGLLGDSLGAKLASIAIDAAISAGLVAITSAKAQATNLANAATVGPPPVTAAMMVAAGAQNAIIAGNSGAQITKILTSAALQGLGTVVSSKFAQGGILQGNSHANGGIQTPYGELEGGEAIITKKATALYAPILSQINQAGDGKAFATGGILGASTLPSTLFDVDELAERISEANQSLPTPVVSVEEINSVNTNVSVIESESSF